MASNWLSTSIGLLNSALNNASSTFSKPRYATEEDTSKWASIKTYALPLELFETQTRRRQLWAVMTEGVIV